MNTIVIVMYSMLCSTVFHVPSMELVKLINMHIHTVHKCKLSIKHTSRITNTYQPQYKSCTHTMIYHHPTANSIFEYSNISIFQSSETWTLYLILINGNKWNEWETSSPPWRQTRARTYIHTRPWRPGPLTGDRILLSLIEPLHMHMLESNIRTGKFRGAGESGDLTWTYPPHPTYGAWHGWEPTVNMT